MKKFLLSIVACFSLAAAIQAQTPTFDETVKYINHRFAMSGYDYPEMKADKYGGVAVYVTTSSRLGFNLKEVKIEALNNEDNGTHLLISCLDGSDCAQSVETNGGPVKELVVYFTSIKEAQRVAKAFAHLKTLSTAKDPFE